jgi:hypothetical protein
LEFGIFVIAWAVNIDQGLIVASKKKRLSVAIDPIAEIQHGMVEQGRRDPGVADTGRLIGFDGKVLDMRIKLGFADRKEAVLQLHGQGAMDAFIGHRIQAAVDLDAVVLDEHGREERQALNMVPMGMGNKDMRGNGHFPGQRMGQRVNAGAGVENDQIIVVGSDFYAGGVAAIFDSVRPRCRNGSPDAPEFEFHNCSLGCDKRAGLCSY